MAPKKSAGKRQHIIPRLYLKRFLEPGFVYRHGQLLPRPIVICSDVAVRVGFYGRPGTDTPFLDDINSYIERISAPPLEKLINKIDDINVTDWLILSYFFANLTVRNPTAIEEMKQTFLDLNKKTNELAKRMIEAVKKNKDAMNQLADMKYPSDRSGIFTLEEINKEVTKLKGKKGHLYAAEGLFANIKKIARCIQKMTFLLLKAPYNNHFVSCDRPLTLISGSTGSPVGAGWGNADAMAIVPLSPDILLTMLYHDEQSIYSHDISAREVRERNLHTIMFADMEVYSSKRNIDAQRWMRSRRL